jgi:hypothetical protein
MLTIHASSLRYMFGCGNNLLVISDKLIRSVDKVSLLLLRNFYRPVTLPSI